MPAVEVTEPVGWQKEEKNDSHKVCLYRILSFSFSSLMIKILNCLFKIVYFIFCIFCLFFVYLFVHCSFETNCLLSWYREDIFPVGILSPASKKRKVRGFFLYLLRHLISLTQNSQYTRAMYFRVAYSGLLQYSSVI